MDLNALKGSILAMSAMKGGEGNILNTIFGFLIIYVTEIVFKAIPIIISTVSEYLKKTAEEKTKSYTDSLINKELKVMSSIVYVYSYKNPNNTCEAIMDYLCKHNNSLKLRFTNNYFIANNELFEFNDQFKIYCKVIKVTYADDGLINKIEFEIFSYNIQLSELRGFMKELENNYNIQKKNQLGDDKYYFNEIPIAPQINVDQSYNLMNLPKNLMFTMTKFNTNKSLSNIYGENLEEIKKRVNLFQNNYNWYKERGIPHTLGILLHGPPGTGKTSTIKAIAKSTNRHIINLSLRKYTTQEQLNNLFYNDIITVLENGTNKTYNIPINQRLYVIEDIDCLTDVVLQRKSEVEEKEEEQQQPIQPIQFGPMPMPNSNIVPRSGPGSSSGSSAGSGLMQYMPSMSNSNIPSMPNSNNRNNNQPNLIPSPNKDNEKDITLNLSYLLNLLDGILEVQGRLLIITSNYPEKLDKALIRPGRIDVMLKFGNCTVNTIEEMYNVFFNTKGVKFDKLCDDKITPAELSKVLASNYDNKEKAYTDIIEYCKNKKLEEDKQKEKKKENNQQTMISNV